MKRRSVQNNESGVALILALLFVVLLTVIVIEFMYEMQVEASFASNGGGEFEAFLAARSAVAKAMGLLYEDALGDMMETGQNNLTGDVRSLGGANRRTSTGSLTGTSSSSTNSRSNASGETVVDAAPWVDSYLDSVPWFEGVPFEPLNNAVMQASISDEFGKINLNALMDYSQSPPVERERLVNALREFFLNRISYAQNGMPDRGDTDDSSKARSKTQSRPQQREKKENTGGGSNTGSGDVGQADMIVDAILDWMDYGDGDEMRTDGAENDYYMSLENPFPCKNGPLDSIEELLMLRGMTIDLYYGNEEDGLLPLNEYLTVHGDWLGRVNVNTASIEVLEAVLAGEGGMGGGPEMAQEIHDLAQEQPFQDPSELSQYTGTSMGAGNLRSGANANAAGRQSGFSGAAGGGITGNSSFMPKSLTETAGLEKSLGIEKQGRGLGNAGEGSRNRGGILGTNNPAQNRVPRQNYAGRGIPPGADPALYDANGDGVMDNPNGMLPGQNASTPVFTVSSNVFRIYGDGMLDDVMVRIEAYVFRTPQDPTALEMALSGMGGGMMGGMQAGNASGGSRGASGMPFEKMAGQAQNIDLDSRSVANALDNASQDGLGGLAGMGGLGMMPEMPAELFRILDWNVIR